MVANPENVEEAMRQYRELRAKNEGKTPELEIMEVEITPDSIKFRLPIPLDENTKERLDKLIETLEPYLERKRNTRTGFKTATINIPAHTIPQIPQPEGWDALPWKDSDYGKSILADEPRAKPLRGMIQGTATGKLDLGGWIYSIGKGRDRDYINRMRKQ